jgi:hypothetical protein
MWWLQAEVPPDQVLQAALLQHGLLFVLGANDLLCLDGVRGPRDLLCSTGFLLHRFDDLLFGSGCDVLRDSGQLLLGPGRDVLRSSADLLHSGCDMLLGAGRQLLCPCGLVSARI